LLCGVLGEQQRTVSSNETEERNHCYKNDHS
jgi:hypothetical protein